MRFFRSQRVSKLIREEASKIFLRDFDFSNALVTITEIDVDKKLNNAKIMISVIPSSSSNYALGILNKNIGSIQNTLLKKINIKPMPRISFEIDNGPLNASIVEKKLLDI
jgi:ribosome-binding factor A